MKERVEERIRAALPDAEVMASTSDGIKVQAVVVSPSFEGMPRVKQHQAVMKAVRDELAGELHALELKTYTPAQWEQAKA
jgi:stress-induced morphogen